MKKFLLGIVLMMMGSANNIAMIIVSAYSSAPNSNWYTQLIAFGLRKPFNFSIIITLVGLAIAIWGVLDKDK